jgi:ectoine hydroxylase-related dioxygenase (phytanoyl-CoA dioxygenase family)
MFVQGSAEFTRVTDMTVTASAALTYRPSYPFEFHVDEAVDAERCLREHGFAVVKGVLTQREVDELRVSVNAVVNPNDDLKPGDTRFHTHFIEVSPPLLRLLENERVISIMRAVIGDCSDGMTVHRSAAILKAVGAPVGAWHRDHRDDEKPPLSHDSFLNRGEWPNGFWFYLDGTHPDRGGLAVIEDSHTPDWPGPAGFELTPTRSSFHRIGQSRESTHDAMDVPGMVPLYTDPGDLILFAARTYHGVFPHNGTQPRASCALICRPGRSRWPVPWKLSESTRQFIDALPPSLKPYFEFYTGLDRNWRG